MPEPGIRPPEFPGRRPSRLKAPHKLILGVATALVVATGVGVAAAGNLTTQAQPTPTPTGMETGGPPGASPGAPSPGPTQQQQMQGPFNAIHGQLVVPKQGGGYQTVTMQSGVVTSIQQNSVAVKSEDGYARTYTLDANTRVCAGREGLSGVKTGHRVWVISTAQGNTSTAIVLADLTQPPWPPRAGGAVTSPQPTTPAPSPYESGTPTGSPVPGESPPVEPTEEPTD